MSALSMTYADQRRGGRRDALAALALSLPAVLLMLVLLFAPALAVLAIAFTDWELGATSLRYVGLENFTGIFRDANFRVSLANTLFYVALVVPANMILGLGIALAIDQGTSLRTFYRTVHFLPVMATLAATAVAWDALLHPTIGLANRALELVGVEPVNWLRNSSTVLPTIAVIGIWNKLGYSVVLFLAGLRSIDQNLYDAAAVDGADGVIDRLVVVTLPMLGPVTLFVLIVSSMKAFQLFDIVQVLTQGGPSKASEVLLYTLYTESFVYMKTGYGAAITVVFLVIMVGLTLLQAAIADRRVHYS
jgi:multiple sugar transport system permease protein